MQICVVFCYKIYLLVVTIDSPSFYYRCVKTSVVQYDPMGTIMKLHLISGAVVVYTALALTAICLAELGATPQNVPF